MAAHRGATDTYPHFQCGICVKFSCPPRPLSKITSTCRLCCRWRGQSGTEEQGKKSILVLFLVLSHPVSPPPLCQSGLVSLFQQVQRCHPPCGFQVVSAQVFVLEQHPWNSCDCDLFFLVVRATWDFDLIIYMSNFYIVHIVCPSAGPISPHLCTHPATIPGGSIWTFMTIYD